MRIVFWQNMLAMITAPCIKALSKMDGIEVVWVVVESLSDERKKIGWDLPDAGDAEIVCAPNRKKIEDLVRDRADESVHIFSGHRTYALLGYAFSICRRTNARIGFFTEGFDGRGIKGIFRFLLCYLDAMANRRRVDFILAVGTYAVRWFAGCGWPANRIYPFAYLEDQFIETRSEIDTDSNVGPVKLIFIGQCIERKGLDILLNALGRLSDLDWNLTVISEGPEKRKLIKLASKLKLSDRIVFLPFLKHAEAMRILYENDLLILPSRFDGWGVVVNEALMLGVPVVCSDRCGASDIIKEVWRGEAFRSGSVSDLERVLRHRIRNGKRTREQTGRIKSWAECLGGKSGAKYIFDVLRAVSGDSARPEPPWLER